MKTITLILLCLTPLVTSAKIQFNVLGAVNKQGHFSSEDTVTVLDALGYAEGISKYGDSKRIKVRKVVAQDKVVVHVLDLNDIINGKSKNLELETGDLVYVSEKIF